MQHSTTDNDSTPTFSHTVYSTQSNGEVNDLLRLEASFVVVARTTSTPDHFLHQRALNIMGPPHLPLVPQCGACGDTIHRHERIIASEHPLLLLRITCPRISSLMVMLTIILPYSARQRSLDRVFWADHAPVPISTTWHDPDTN